MGRRRGPSLGRVAKKAAVATVVNRVVNNAMDNRMGQRPMNNRNIHQPTRQHVQQPLHQQSVQMQQQPVMNNICPSCNSANPQHAKFCLNCGGGIATVAQNVATPPSNCPGCKASLVGINGNFCPYCRTAIG